MSHLFAFSYCSWGSQGRNTEAVCQSLLQWTTSVRTLYHDPSILGGPTWHGSCGMPHRGQALKEVGRGNLQMPVLPLSVMEQS